MKKSILHTLGLAAMAALLCVVCGDNGTNGSGGGEVNALLSKYNKKGGDEPSLVLADGEAWVYNDSGYIFTTDNRLITIFASDGGWWYTGTEYGYQISKPIVTIDNDIPRRYTISSGNILLIDGYTYTFTKKSANPQKPYYLTVSVSGPGSVSRVPEKSVYSYGEQVAVTATARFYSVVFIGWSGASESTSATIDITMDSGKNLTATFVVIPYFTDSRDNKIYKRVSIGTQMWIGENLNYAADGSKCYGDDDSNCDRYGRLYNWSTAMDGASSSWKSPSGVRGVCPEGWHIPSDDEWTTLMNYVGSNAGTKLKSTSGWNSGGNGTDDFGWSALPGGFGNNGGSFDDAGNGGSWWSATEYNASNTWWRGITHEDVNRNHRNKTNLFSVRCAQDD